jgi:hypothetical protein
MWGSWKLAHIIPSPLSEWIIHVGDAVAERVEDATSMCKKILKKYYVVSKKYVLNLKKRMKK